MKKFLAVAGGTAFGLGLVEAYWELHHFCMTEYQLHSRKFQALDTEKKILFLSDLHNHEYGRNNEVLLAAIQAEQPDLILIGGDMIVSYEYSGCRKTIDFLKKLPSICPVYYANGNHEQRAKEFPGSYSLDYGQYKQELEASGISFLENAAVCFTWGDLCVRITGLEIPVDCYTHLRRVPLYRADIWKRIGRKDPEDYDILLAHNPAYMQEYQTWGADLILSGHLHGGVVRFPGLGGAVTPDFRLFPRYSGGFYQEETSDIVVSKGLGTHTINFRLGNPAEVVCLRLMPDQVR